MSYTQEDSRYWGSTGGDWVLEINVMQCRYVSDTEGTDVYNTIESAVDRIYSSSRTSLDGAITRRYDTENIMNCDNRFNDGNHWLNNNGFGGSEGCYLWITNCNKPGVAAGSGAWTGRSQGLVSVEYYGSGPGNDADIIGIMESLHPYILHPCEYVQDMLYTDDEHQLGKGIEYTGTIDHHTPMTAGYNFDAHHGECQGGSGGPEGWTDTLTLCTIDAVEFSKDHVRTGGSH